jgi:glycolate oxidase
MDRSVVQSLESLVGRENVVTRIEQMQNYVTDETPAFIRPTPARDLVLVKPETIQHVVGIMQFADRKRIPVFPRGGGTGLAGGAVPTKDGIILSFEKMKRIEIDKENMMAVAEAGVTLAELNEAAEDMGLAFPPHPGDENAQVGGLIATNAGGSRAVRHGVMRNHVRALDVVLANGEVLRLGAKVHKNNVSYDLMQLIIGSEGTLGIVTGATIQLYPKSGTALTLVVPYDNRLGAMASVQKILGGSTPPLAIEYVEKELMERTAKHLGKRWPVKDGKCYLIIIVSEPNRDQALAESLRISEACKENTSYEVFAAESEADQQDILEIRSNIYTVLKPETLDILDVVVPLAKLEETFAAIEGVAQKAGVAFTIFGHAGDGNIHVHIMRDEGKGSLQAENLRNEVYEIATALGGVITGEHGIGKVRLGKLEKFATRQEVELMKSIKKVFDPNYILNPGTKVPA